MAVERTGKARRGDVKQRERRHREEESGLRRRMEAVKKEVREKI